MRKTLKHILLIIMLLVAAQAAGQYTIDSVCVGSVRYYRTDGEPGSTYIWKLTDPLNNVTILASTADTVEVLWNVVPGIYKLSTIQHSVVTGCDGVLELGDIKVFGQPLAFAGNPQFVCVMTPYQLFEATASNYRSLLWTTTGDGTFNNNTILNPVYTPGPSDIAAGNVTLTLTATGLGAAAACPPVSSSVTITEYPPALANAGPDDVSCEFVNYQVTGATASNYSSIMWTHNGTGSFLDPTLLNPVYVPGINETGNVTLKITAYELPPCIDSISDQMVLNLLPAPTGMLTLAGSDTLCGGDTTSLRLDLTGTAPWSAIISDGTNNYNISNITTSPYFFDFVPLSTGSYTIVSLNDANCPAPASTLGGVVFITVNPRPGADFTWNYGPQNNIIEFHIDTNVVNMPAVGNMILWYFGDGIYGYGTDPVHTYPTTGTYLVTLTVTDTNGCVSTGSHSIYIPETPLALFESTSPACNGDSICFTDHSYVPLVPFGYITTWQWSFGDGSPDVIVNFPNIPNVCHLYPGVGTYTATLSITSNLGYTASYSRDQLVIPGPIADFAFTTGCSSQPVQFTNTSDENNSGIITSWQWNFEDPVSGTNNTSTLENPSHIFSIGNTTYFVTLIISTSTNCKDTITKPVYVLPGPPVDFVHDSACLASIVTFNGNTGITQIDSIATWSWNFGDGLPGTNDPLTTTHSYVTVGVFTVTLTVTDIHGCSNSVSHQVNVHSLPIPFFNWNAPACSGSFVQFDDASYMPAGSTGYVAKWEWDFGDGSPVQTISLPGNPDISHLFNTASLNFNVKLKIWSNDSCTQEITRVVTLIPAPIADFQTSSISCENQPVQFTDISSLNGGGSISSWYWNFDDPLSGTNNTSTLQNPVHSFTAAGSYNVKLIITGTAGCNDTVVKSVSTGILPVASFIADTACLGTPTSFTSTSVANSSFIANYNWNFGDGGYSTVQNPVHTFTTDGLHTVTLQITNSNGCINSVSQQVMVHPLPLASFTWSGVNCLGASVTYVNTSTIVPASTSPVTRWVWDFGDGTTASVSSPAPLAITHIFAGNALSHIVRLTVVTTDSCQAFVEHKVISLPSPTADFVSSSNTCEGQSVTFTDHSIENGGGNIVGWNWNFGDPVSGTNNNSTLQNPVHIFSNPGTYQVVLVITNAGNCDDTIAKTIVIGASPVAAFVADTACLSEPTNFTSQTAPSDTIVLWQWTFGDGGTASQQNPAHTYLIPGIYTASLTIITNRGCTNSISHQVLVLDRPVAAFMASSPNCLSDSVQFNDFSSTPQGSIVDWMWDFGDGNTSQIHIPASPNIKHLYSAPNTYLVKLTVTTSDGCSADFTMPVVVHPAPAADFSYPNNTCQNIPIQFTDLTQNAGGSTLTQWLWNFDDPGSGIDNTSTLQNPVHDFSTTGIFDVVLTVTNSAGCVDTVLKQVSTGAAPLAQFSATEECTGTPTQFTDASIPSSGTIIAWLWNFGEPVSGGNNTSTLQNPVHNYSSAGIFQVTLTVVNSSNCTHDTVISVNVASKPVALFEFSQTCVNALTQFTDLSTSQGSIITSWFWDFGDGIGTSTIQNPVYSYTTSGTYNVMLRVMNITGCSDSISIPVVSMPAPNAAFAYNSFYCPAGSTNFQDQSNSIGGPITERLWIFEPGYTSSLPNPTYVFPVTDTTYIVTLIVTDNNGCRDTITDSVYVKPGFLFSFTSDNVCFNTPMHFTPLNLTPGDSLYFVKWEFGDPASGNNNISYDYNAFHTFTRPGFFVVKLTIVNSNNCTDSILRNVEVYAPPAPDFTYTVNTGGRVYFDDVTTSGSGSIVSWTWNFGDGSPVVTIPAPGPADTSHLYIPGVYVATLTVTNSYGCSNTVTKTVSLISTLSAGFAHHDSIVCAEHPVIFQDYSTPVSAITNWQWYFGDGSDTAYTSYAANVIHTYSNTGNYVVTLIVEASINGMNFSDTTRKNISIRPAAIAAFQVFEGCADNLTFFKDTVDNGNIIREWNFGDPGSGASNYSSLKNPSHKYNSAGNYNVELIVLNENGCSDTLSKPLRVHALPEALFDNTLACSSNPIYFTDKSKIGDTAISTWNWNFGDMNTTHDISDLQDPVYEYKEGGKYVVRMVVRDRFGCYDTVDSTVNVFVSPLSAFLVSDNAGLQGKIMLINKSEGADEYFWDFGDGSSSEDENPIVTYSEDGTYLIKLIAYSKEDCSDTTTYRYEHMFKGLYIPNAFIPTSSNPGVMIFKPIGVNLAKYSIEVYDGWGHLLWQSTAIDNNGHPLDSWDGKDLKGNLMPSGTYMWKVNAIFTDGTIWEGSDIGKGEGKNIGTVTLIR